MGTIIGRQGLKIKHIQDVSGVRMVAQKEMLPQSTERVVEVQGTPDGIQRAIWEICKCLIDDWQRGTGTVLYNPVVRTQPGGATSPLGVAGGSVGGAGGGGGSGSGGGYGAASREYATPRVTRTGNGADFSNGGARPYRRSDSDAATRDRQGPPTHDENGEEIQTQNISIPADMVGCIIGRAGTKISEIRKTSGARISIAKVSCRASAACCGRRMPGGGLTSRNRLPTTRRARGCSQSWDPPKQTRRLCSCCMRISRPRRCAAAR